MENFNKAIDVLSFEEAMVMSELFFDQEFSDIYTEAEAEVIEVRGLKAKAKRIISALVNLIKTIVKMLSKAMKTLSDKITKKIKAQKVKSEVKRLKKMLAAYGDKPVMFMDVWEYESVFTESVKVLTNYVDSFLKSYEKDGKGLLASTNFLDKCQKTMDSYQEKLDTIKKKKVEAKASKILKWIDRNVDEKGMCKGVMKRYMYDLEKTQEKIKGIEEKVDVFLKKNDYIRDPKGFNEFMHNTTRYVAKNVDWISMYAISAVSALTSFISKSTLKGSYEKFYLTGGGSMSIKDNNDTDDDNSRVFANQKWKDKSVKAKRKTIHKVGKISSASTAAVGSKIYFDAKKNHRNSI